jgi:hypothetical protein
MKIERGENSIRLKPETEFERECLKVLRREKGSIKRMSFEDDWNDRGDFNIIFNDINDHYGR